MKDHDLNGIFMFRTGLMLHCIASCVPWRGLVLILVMFATYSFDIVDIAELILVFFLSSQQ